MEKAEFVIVKGKPSLYFDDLIVDYLEQLVDYDQSYIQSRMDTYMEEKRNDFGEFVEIDDMRVCNAELTDMIKRIKELIADDPYLVYVPASVTEADEE